jgi:hypothetical protein
LDKDQRMAIDRAGVRVVVQPQPQAVARAVRMLPEDVCPERPIDLRHPVVFYDGHLPGLASTLVKKALGGPASTPASRCCSPAVSIRLRRFAAPAGRPVRVRKRMAGSRHRPCVCAEADATRDRRAH